MADNNRKTKLITARQVQEELLPLDIRKVRAFLNTNCKYRKIGGRYFYVRKDVETKLIEVDGNITYRIDGKSNRNKARRQKMKIYPEKRRRNNKIKYRIVIDATINGERDRRYRPLPEGTSWAEAERICKRMSLEMEYGTYIPEEPMLFSEYVEQIYFPKYTTELSPTTYQHYRQLYNAKGGIKEQLGNKYLSEITTETLQDMSIYYKALGRAPKTIRNYVSLVTNILKMAKVDDYLRRDTPNPREFLRLPKLVSQEGNAYSMEQVMLMFRRAEDSHNLNIQLLLALTCLAGGLRRSELVALRWEDISLERDNSYIAVQRAAVYANGKIHYKNTKTRAGQRTIPISSDGLVYKILSNARRQYLIEQSQALDFNGDNHVFILHHEPYTPVSPNRLYKLYKTFLEKECSDLPHYRLHDLRHTYFSWCSDIGFNELTITATGGHSSIRSTRRYQHATMERMRSDMEKLEEAFERQRKKA